MSDTSTTLNPGTGGDVMDESLVTQSDKVTQAKRPRVVPGGDDGSMQTFEKQGGSIVTAAHVIDINQDTYTEMLLQEMRLLRVVMQQILVQMGGDYMTPDDLQAFVEE